jgi:preprotein translocase subunit SecB
MSETAEQPVFSIEKLYVKDLSLEVPNAPQIYLEREAPRSASSCAPKAMPSTKACSKSS